jgi:ankyrin repeat protein
MLQFLISNGCDVNVRDSKGNTPLHYAIQNENIMYATVLLKGKAKQLKNNEGLTPKKMKKFLDSK